MIFLNVLVGIIFVLVIYITYIKIRYPFWSGQPVLHSYGLRLRWRKTPYYVYPNSPVKTKFCDFENVNTESYIECSLLDKNNLLNMIQCYYISTEKLLYTLQPMNMDALFTSNRELSYVSFFNEYRIDFSMNQILEMTSVKKPIAAITSRYVNFYVAEQGAAAAEEFYKLYPMYYVDYLSVNRHRDVKNISRKLLQTHEYNTRLKNPNVKCSLIKKEIVLFDGVIPLVRFNTSTFHLRNNNFPLLPPHHEILKISKENIDLLMDFINVHTKTDARIFEVFVVSDIGSLLEQIHQGLLFVYCLRKEENIYGFYFIRDAKTEYENVLNNDGKVAARTLHCIGSFCNTRNERFFYLGFLHALHDIVKMQKDYRMLIFDEIGHNVYLYSHWRKKYTPIFVTPSAYYLFNLIYPCSPILPEKVLVFI
jgi:hypothetical protein